MVGGDYGWTFGMAIVGGWLSQTSTVGIPGIWRGFAIQNACLPFTVTKTGIWLATNRDAIKFEYVSMGKTMTIIFGGTQKIAETQIDSEDEHFFTTEATTGRLDAAILHVGCGNSLLPEAMPETWEGNGWHGPSDDTMLEVWCWGKHLLHVDFKGLNMFYHIEIKTQAVLPYAAAFCVGSGWFWPMLNSWR